VRIVGDRFVFQSELLFPTASAKLEPSGEAELDKVAQTLKEIIATMPKDVDWILRVDGHTDPRNINTLEFPSNWELSTARATAVVKYLISQGIPADRLAATGFGEFQPIDPGRTEEAYQKNRRIEFKFTER
jgi:chemotaxis protein MotB